LAAAQAERGKEEFLEIIRFSKKRKRESRGPSRKKLTVWASLSKAAGKTE